MTVDAQNSINVIKSPIISCSRRTDIPAFLMDWVLERIRDGYVDVVNPFNRSQVSRVSLSPNDVKCWVWWSKNFEYWIKAYNENKDVLGSYRGHFFQFTINSPSELERNVNVSLEERFSQLRWLISEFSTDAISYRFDPIILYRKNGDNSIRSNLNKFEYIVKSISALGIREMIFSFATIYSKVKNRMIKRGYLPLEVPIEEKITILKKSQKICKKYNVSMKACCQPNLLEVEGIKQAHCIDAYKIEKIVGEPIPKIRDTGQRESCGCYKSKDIGGYTGIFRCKHNCDYCYASPAKK